jgi:hypothetical protein
MYGACKIANGDFKKAMHADSGEESHLPMILTGIYYLNLLDHLKVSTNMQQLLNALQVIQ